MRNAFCQALVEAASRPDFVFLTGDLGYKALEPLREAMGPRFINAGVAEQNMVSVAAGLARSGLRPWVYSIAPFVYARPFEQIRNDVCLHKLAGRAGGQWRRLWLRRDGSDPPRAGRLWRTALLASPASLRAGLRRGRQGHGQRPFLGQRTLPTSGWGSPRSRRMRPFRRMLPGASSRMVPAG